LKRILRVAAIALLTIVFLALFLWNSNLRVVWRIIESADFFWLAAALCINWFAVIFRTFRWRIILDPDAPPPFYPTFFANAIGYMVSTILPIRAADVVRPVLLSRRTGLRVAGAFGTVLTERVLDLFSLLALFVYFVIVAPAAAPAAAPPAAAFPRTCRRSASRKSGSAAAETVRAIRARGARIR
jgi:uncharacterized protein (TIRG00374 family)